MYKLRERFEQCRVKVNKTVFDARTQTRSLNKIKKRNQGGINMSRSVNYIGGISRPRNPAERRVPLQVVLIDDSDEVAIARTLRNHAALARASVVEVGTSNSFVPADEGGSELTPSQVTFDPHDKLDAVRKWVEAFFLPAIGHASWKVQKVGAGTLGKRLTVRVILVRHKQEQVISDTDQKQRAMKSSPAQPSKTNVTTEHEVQNTTLARKTTPHPGVPLSASVECMNRSGERGASGSAASGQQHQDEAAPSDTEKSKIELAKDQQGAPVQAEVSAAPSNAEDQSAEISSPALLQLVDMGGNHYCFKFHDGRMAPLVVPADMKISEAKDALHRRCFPDQNRPLLQNLHTTSCEISSERSLAVEDDDPMEICEPQHSRVGTVRTSPVKRPPCEQDGSRVESEGDGTPGGASAAAPPVEKPVEEAVEEDPEDAPVGDICPSGGTEIALLFPCDDEDEEEKPPS
ncbi:unnamed protein product [Amoebophrya sp. A120]|nr:unnamed protein product [Amoebophrya sp. A120]|eukprot:GSA120T00018631001.1